MKRSAPQPARDLAILTEAQIRAIVREELTAVIQFSRGLLSDKEMTSYLGACVRTWRRTYQADPALATCGVCLHGRWRWDAARVLGHLERVYGYGRP